MSVTTDKMSLVKWTAGSDPYNHTQLADNFEKLDEHDHTTGKGVQIPTGGIANLAVTNAKIASGIDGAKLLDGSVTADKLDSGAVPNTFVFYEDKTWTVPGEIRAPSGTPTQDYIPPFYFRLSADHTAKLIACYYVLEQGSVTAKLRKKTWGGAESDITGFTGIGVTTTDAETNPSDVTLADKDRIRLVLSSPGSTPWNLSFTIIIEHTVTAA